jgi:hypothetical protein
MDSVFEDYTYKPKPKQDEKLESYARVIDMVVLKKSFNNFFLVFWWWCCVDPCKSIEVANI